MVSQPLSGQETWAALIEWRKGLRSGWTVVNASADLTIPAAGVISVGGHKQSGIGTEGGIDGIKEYMTRTAVQVLM